MVECFCFFSRPFFLAEGLVGAVLLGSFQACAIYIPAAPDVQGDWAKSKPQLLRGRRGLGWSWVGGGALGEHIAGEGLVSVGDGASDAVKFQQTGRVSCHSCVGDLGGPPVDQGVGERNFETGWDGSGLRLG